MTVLLLSLYFVLWDAIGSCTLFRAEVSGGLYFSLFLLLKQPLGLLSARFGLAQ